MNNIHKVLNSAYVLNSIIRFGIVPRLHLETVAAHGFFVAFSVMLLSDYIPGIDKLKAIKIALVHDIEESESGDIPNTVKKNFPEFNFELEQITFSMAKKIFADSDEYINLWSESRGTDSIESKLVKFADMLSVILYASEEINLGNKYMNELYNRQLKAINEFCDSIPEFIQFKEMLLKYENGNI